MLLRLTKDRRGTAMIETALMVPFLLFLMVIGIEIGMILNAEINVSGVARTAGRIASTQDSSLAGIAAGRSAGEARRMDLSQLHITAARHGSVWAIGVTYQYNYLVPFIGALLGGGTWHKGGRLIDSVAYYRAET